jgi:SAM-dependent methyltransferase
MNPDEYAKLDRIDRTHWFYRGKRAIVEHWIDRSAALGPGDLLVDVGCGTGVFLAEMAARRRVRVLGIDDHAESIALTRPRVEALGGAVLEGGFDGLPVGDASAAVVTALDVIEHVDDDRAALGELARICRPGGLVVLTVPALDWLWSDWDEALHHRRRYDRAGLLRLLLRPELELVHCGYFNTVALPAIAAVRTLRKLRPPAPGALRAEDRVPAGWLNALLFRLLVVPARSRMLGRVPGVSLLAVLRRRPTV